MKIQIMNLLKISSTDSTVVIGLVVIILVGLWLLHKYKTRQNDKAAVDTAPKVTWIARTPIEVIAAKLDMYVTAIKVSLGLHVPIECPAKTKDEAEQLFYDAAEDSEEEYAALLRWINLEDDLYKMETIWHHIENYPFLCKTVSEKWEMLSMKAVLATDNEDELEDLFAHVPLGSDAQVKIIQKLHQKYHERSRLSGGVVIEY
jgi:hypothetical protein